MVNLGTIVDAGVFNREVVVQRNLISSSADGAKIKDTLSSCPPSSLLLFEDSGSRIKDALDAARSSARPSTYWGSKRFLPKSRSKKPASSPAEPKVSSSVPSATPAGKGKGRGGQQKPPAQ